ncbi:hypothetical protein ACFYPX_09435 [Micromonospora zamorensis]|uniref:hypothetical protein n=1 Tax=Micromonospora zamorensis TaxID=709883 RepID=UPI00368840AB
MTGSPKHPMADFIASFGAARHLLQQAHENGSLIEGMVLYVSLIDGFLRTAIILDKQLAGQSDDLDKYVQQVPGGARFTEKAIYDEALRRGLIDAKLKAEVVELYEHRNAIVHRFFLTGLRYTDLEPYLGRYELVYAQVYGVVRELEDRQIREGKGMTVRGDDDDSEEVASSLADVGRKLGFPVGLS